MERSLSAQETEQTPRAPDALTMLPSQPPWGWRGIQAAGWAGWAHKGDQRGRSYIGPRPLPHTPPPPPPPHRGQETLSQPKVAFHFLRGNVEGAEGEGLSQLLSGWGQYRSLTGTPQRPRKQGLRVCPTKAGTSLSPAQEGAPPSPQTSQETCQAGTFSPNTCPQNRKEKKGNNLLTQGYPAEGEQKSGPPRAWAAPARSSSGRIP